MLTHINMRPALYRLSYRDDEGLVLFVDTITKLAILVLAHTQANKPLSPWIQDVISLIVIRDYLLKVRMHPPNTSASFPSCHLSGPAET